MASVCSRLQLTRIIWRSQTVLKFGSLMPSALPVVSRFSQWLLRVIRRLPDCRKACQKTSIMFLEPMAKTEPLMIRHQDVYVLEVLTLISQKQNGYQLHPIALVKISCRFQISWFVAAPFGSMVVMFRVTKHALWVKRHKSMKMAALLWNSSCLRVSNLS